MPEVNSPVAAGADGPGQGEGGPDRFGNGRGWASAPTAVVELPVKVCGPDPSTIRNPAPPSKVEA